MPLRLTREEVLRLAKQGRLTLPPDLALLTTTPPPKKRRRAPDLGPTAFRSSWERNAARYFNLLIAQGHLRTWAYEPKIFTFPVIRGCREYRPDFQLTWPDGHQTLVEVKGHFDQRSKTRLKRMRIHYPTEVVEIYDREWFAGVIRQGIAGAIPHWEAM